MRLLLYWNLLADADSNDSLVIGGDFRECSIEIRTNALVEVLGEE